MSADWSRRLVAEGIGTALLLTAVVGSAIMAERLAAGNLAITLLANSLATAGALAALILALGSVSGAHFNPAVTAADASLGGLGWRDVPAYVLVQIAGAMIGVWTAHMMFGEPILEASLRERSGSAQLFSEFVATFGLLAVICGCSRRRPSAVPFAVAAYIGAAFWFTASTSFANPAVTLARAFTDSVAGIRPADVPGFILSQLAGALTATLLFSWVVPRVPETRRARPLRTVLFACVHNAGRSQMAAAWFNLIADPDKARAISAGTDPGTHVHPEVVEAMREAGLDLSRAATTRLTPDVAQQAQLLVTMGCGDQCPVVPGAKRDDWPLDDPKGKPIAQVRAIRDDIRDRVWTLVEREGWLRS